MIKTFIFFGAIILQSFLVTAEEKNKPESSAEESKHPVVIIKTNFGPIVVKLDAEKAPITVKNFLSYVKESYYDSTIFHRVIQNFMIQGGGFTVNFTEKPTKLAIKNEAANGLKNKRGTIAMARKNVNINSATCQFFINHKDNDFLDHKDNTLKGYGYAVFGEVIMGMEVVDIIAAVPTSPQDVPLKTVVIETIMLNE
ncbi:MAG TPA: peptidyl-prolyl cis-trans isomerase [bacterium]|nr:peptidyl-prolyl cis-trans isomerase [bacterium]